MANNDNFTRKNASNPPVWHRQPARTDSDTTVRDRRALSILALVGAAVCIYAMRRADADLWGNLAYGRFFVENGGPGASDPFSYTCAGCMWAAHEYLTQILLWQVYHFGGPIGLIALKCVVGAFCVGFLWLAIRTTTADASVWFPVFLLATSTIARYFLFRPQLFTFAFLAIYVAVLFRHLLQRSNVLWVLPVVMLAWANLHGGFLAGLGVLCLAVAVRVFQNANAFGTGRRLLAGTAGLWLALWASVLVTFVNPIGWRLWPYVAAEMFHDTSRKYIGDWQATLRAGDYWSTVSITLLLAILLTVGWLSRRSRPLIGGLRAWQWVASCAPLAAMAFVSVRHIPIAAIWIAPVVTLLASQLTEQREASRAFRRARIVVAALSVVPAVLTFLAVAVQPLPRVDVAGTTLGSKHPCRAVAFMKQNHLSGNLYVPLWWGSYVTWQLFPAVRVSMDGRNISLFPDDMVIENLKFYLTPKREADLDAPLRFDTDFLLVPSDALVLSDISGDHRWQTIFMDSDSTLFVRRERALTSMTPLAEATPMPSSAACPAWMQ